jgi:hypothetical protein
MNKIFPDPPEKKVEKNNKIISLASNLLWE